MKISNIVVFVVLAATLPLGSAHASIVTGSFGISVYQGPGGGLITSPGVQANAANPLIAPLYHLYTGTYTGPIDFKDLGTNDILTFLLSAGGSLSGITTALSTTMSTPTFALTTVLDITWADAAALSGTIDHDDGVTLYLNGGAITPAASAVPTVEIETAFAAGGGGAYRLIYVAGNGLPEVLSVDVVVPEVSALATWSLLGLVTSVFLNRRKSSRV